MNTSPLQTTIHTYTITQSFIPRVYLGESFQDEGNWRWYNKSTGWTCKKENDQYRVVVISDILHCFGCLISLHNFWCCLIFPRVFSIPMRFGQILNDIALSSVLICPNAPYRVCFVHNKILFSSIVFAFSCLYFLQQWHDEALCSPSVALSFCPADTITHIPPCCHLPRNPARKHHGTICFAQKWDIYHCWTPARNREWTGVGFHHGGW